MHKNIEASISNFDHMPNEALIRPQACAQILGIGLSTFWKMVARGEINTVKLTERTRTVRAGELRAFMSSKARL